MHIAIIGAGGVGSVYGGYLARSGQQVTLIDLDSAHVNAIQDQGLTVVGPSESFTIPVTATTDPATVVEAEVALICVNAYDTHAAAQTARQILTASGYAATLQNGLGNIEVMHEVLGANRVMGGITYHSAALTGPGQVNHTNPGPTYLGELNQSPSPRLEKLAAAMTAAGLEPEIPEDIMAIIWGKFVHNCGVNAICAMTDLKPGHIKEVPELDTFQTRIIEETLALVAAKEITLPDPDPLGSLKAFCEHRYNRPSMMQHLARRLPTEIDSLNGYVVQESARLGLAAPYNDALARLVKGRQHQPA